MGIGAPGQRVGSHAKNLAESTNREFRRLGLRDITGYGAGGEGKRCNQFIWQREKLHIVLSAFQAYSF